MTGQQYATAYELGYSRTIRLLRFRGAPGDIAEDVAQAAWTHGWWKLDQLRDERVLLPWINTIALNKYRRAAAEQARYRELPELKLHGKTGTEIASLDMASILANSRSCDRRLLELHLRGLTSEEIATAYGVPKGAIRLRLLRARTAALKRLGDNGRASKEPRSGNNVEELHKQSTRRPADEPPRSVLLPSGADHSCDEHARLAQAVAAASEAVYTSQTRADEAKRLKREGPFRACLAEARRTGREAVAALNRHLKEHGCGSFGSSSRNERPNGPAVGYSQGNVQPRHPLLRIET